MSVEWNGEGRPPVGCECEVQYWNDGLHEKVRIIAWHGNEAWVEFTECKGKTSLIGNPEFRPIRTEAERKREEAINALSEHFGHGAGLYNISGLYDKIAAGKIPHITLK